jgi:hypothetical protein
MLRTQIISLKDPAVVRRIVRAIARKPDLCARAFREVARNHKLQKQILLVVLARYPAHEREFIAELVGNPQVRREILKLTGNQKLK